MKKNEQVFRKFKQNRVCCNNGMHRKMHTLFRGEHKSSGKHIDGDIAAQAVIDICNNYDIKSLMTFGGEPLIYPEVVCNIHKTAKEMNIKIG